jgi:hypothetical protein
VVKKGLQQDRLKGEVKRLAYSLIVENFQQRKDLDHESIQVSRNVIDLFVEVLKNHQKQDIYSVEQLLGIVFEEYLQAENQYNEVLKRFNLGDLAQRDTFSTLISGQVSAAELTDRVVNVYDRIRNADPALRSEIDRVESLSRGQLSDADFAKALLTGETGANELKRKISTAEISAEARQRNLSVARAQELQQLGVTREEARAGFETIAQARPVFEKLTGIYDREQLDPEQSQTELEREVFQGMASERRKRVTQQEQATFSGRSGLASSALSSQRAGQI